MRIDNNDPHKIYKDFWDWLFNYNEHIMYVVVLVVGYYVYLNSTTKV